MPIAGRPRVGFRHSLEPVGIYVLVNALATIQADLSAPTFSDGEEGDQTNATIAVRFSESVTSSNFATGVTIKLNGVGATISSATLQGDPAYVYYVLSSPYADANDAITWEYSDVAGDIQDSAGNQLGDVVATAITNNVGRHLRFDDAPNSMHFAWL